MLAARTGVSERAALRAGAGETGGAADHCTSLESLLGLPSADGVGAFLGRSRPFWFKLDGGGRKDIESGLFFFYCGKSYACGFGSDVCLGVRRDVVLLAHVGR